MDTNITGEIEKIEKQALRESIDIVDTINLVMRGEIVELDHDENDIATIKECKRKIKSVIFELNKFGLLSTELPEEELDYSQNNRYMNGAYCLINALEYVQRGTTNRLIRLAMDSQGVDREKSINIIENEWRKEFLDGFGISDDKYMATTLDEYIANKKRCDKK